MEFGLLAVLPGYQWQQLLGEAFMVFVLAGQGMKGVRGNAMYWQESDSSL
jgi:hypothetical protein